jgi:carboxypeptidase family protein
MKRAIHFLLIFCCAVALCATASAQVQTTSAITGTVTDSSGAVMPGVKITVRNGETGAVRETITNDAGHYSVQALRPGKYSITAALPGFKTAVVKDREVQVSIPAAVSFVLELGDVSQEITVSAEGQELINTTTGTLATTISENLVQNLPNQTRNFFDLVALSPNTSGQYFGNGGLSFGSHSMRRVNAAGSLESSGVFAAGSTDSATNVSIDGANIQMALYNMPVNIQSASTIKELRIETASANAEFGYGSNAINVITKNGTNSYHGEAFWQHRNDNLDAKNFFTNLAGTALPEYKRNKFGATLGGPILKDKFHYFGNYEGARLRQNVQGNAIVPTAQMRSGDLSAYRPLLPGQVLGPTPVIYNPFDFDPASGLRRPFPGNRIPTSLLDPSMQKLLSYTQLPNTVIDGVPQYSGLSNSIIDENQWGIRLDWEKSAKTTIYGRYTWGERDAFNGGLVSELQGEKTPSSTHSTVIHWNQVLSPTMINDFSVSYSRVKWGIGRPLDVPDVSKEMGWVNTSDLNGGPGLTVPDLVVGASGLFVWDPTQNTYALKDDFSLTKGKHSIKVGFNLNERRLYFLNQSFDKGRLTFDNIFTRACPLGNTVCEQARVAASIPQGGLGFADYLLGAATGAFLELRGVVWHGHQRYWGGYVQDTWQIHPRLTLNFGLRYEQWPAWLLPRNNTVRYNFSGSGGLEYALQNPLDVFNPATDYGRNAPLNPNMPRQGYEADKLNFGPRVGIAFRLTENTSLRAAGGIFYAGNVNTNQFSDAMTGGAPFIIRSTQVIAGSEQLPPFVTRTLFPSPAASGIPGPNENPPAAPRALGEKEYPTPTVYQWSASLEHRLTSYWSASIDYLGSHTIHNQQFVDLNAPALPQGNLANLSLQERRRFPAWGQWLTWVNWGYSNYNSSTFSVRNREWRGLTLLSSFMWAKNLSSSISPIANDRNNFDYRQWDLWRGKAALTPDRRFVTAFSYRLPFGKGQKYGMSGVWDAVLGGWILSGITEFSTGVPQTIMDLDNSGTGNGNQHANRLDGCDVNNAPRDRFQWFNTGCFVAPAFGTWGNGGQGIVNDPGINNWNSTFAKTFRIREGHSLEFRFETYNTFNHTQWLGANYTRSNANFGRITGARPARQVQAALFYRF